LVVVVIGYSKENLKIHTGPGRSMQVAYGQSVWTCGVPHQAPAVWPWHQCQAIWTLAIIPRQTRRLQSGGNLRSALWDHWRRCVANDDRQTAGMTDNEHHIGRRFLRRRIDGSPNWRTKT